MGPGSADTFVVRLDSWVGWLADSRTLTRFTREHGMSLSHSHRYETRQNTRLSINENLYLSASLPLLCSASGSRSTFTTAVLFSHHKRLLSSRFSRRLYYLGRRLALSPPFRELSPSAMLLMYRRSTSQKASPSLLFQRTGSASGAWPSLSLSPVLFLSCVGALLRRTPRRPSSLLLIISPYITSLSSPWTFWIFVITTFGHSRDYFNPDKPHN